MDVEVDTSSRPGRRRDVLINSGVVFGIFAQDRCARLRSSAAGESDTVKASVDVAVFRAGGYAEWAPPDTIKRPRALLRWLVSPEIGLVAESVLP